MHEKLPRMQRVNGDCVSMFVIVQRGVVIQGTGNKML